MAGVQSNDAARAIRESCLRKSEQLIPENTLHGFFLGARAGVAKDRLSVSFNNNSGFTFTELTIGVSDKKTSQMITLRSFEPQLRTMPGGGGYIVSPPMDRLSPGLQKFTVTLPTPMDAKTFQWDVVSAKGFAD
jgi:hypothetical protein